MGLASREKGVLKLVRPGGIVERYKNPVTAAEVMERYPRHCVTRPDVFKFPYIVVRPESVLVPGRVFFIVPCYTIRRLLQNKGYPCHRHRPPHHCEESAHAVSRGTTTSDGAATEEELKEEYYYHGKEIVEYTQPVIEPNSRRRCIKQPSDKSLDHMENYDPSFFHHMIIPDNWHDVKPVKSFTHTQKDMPPSRQVRHIDYDSDEAVAAVQGCFVLRKKGGGLLEASKGGATRKAAVISNLKPCLKKHRTNKTRSQQGPRVTFKFPEEDEDDDDREKWDTDFSFF